MSTLAAAGLLALNALTGASTLVAADVIRAGERITPDKVAVEGETADPADKPILGREVRRTVYAGQAITLDNTRPARLVKRNQVVTVKYISGALEISLSGRAMEAAALGEPVTVLNLNSREMIHGIVQKDGWVLAQ